MEQDFGAAMFDAAFKARAFPVYAAMRERGPVTRIALPNGESFCLVTRYAACLELLKDHERFANDPINALTEEEYAALFQQATERLTPEHTDPEVTLLYLHGGGYTVGSARTHRGVASRLAAA